MTFVSCPACGRSLRASGARVPQHTAGERQCRGSGGPSEADLQAFVRGIYPPNAELIVAAVRDGIKSTKSLICGCGTLRRNGACSGCAHERLKAAAAVELANLLADTRQALRSLAKWGKKG